MLKSEKGLSLIEVLIATAVLAFALTSLTLAASTGVLSAGKVTQRGTVLDVARAQMENVKGQPYKPCASAPCTSTYSTLTGTDPYTTSVSVSTVVTGLQTITVTVYSAGSPLFYLEDLKGDR
ncbi:MAG: prepilin-type N-terminal cleavage/methylation domain-containing protein [Dehalococcoidia bacterium]|nr:prepilin-type N-terminal cleavage/methylation domain-containing protein [Dehalococcoidia bacterium]